MATPDSSEVLVFLRTMREALSLQIDDRFRDLRSRIDTLDLRLQAVEGQMGGIIALLKPMYDMEARVRKLEEAVFHG